jgi:hypothetical protein
MANNNNAAVEKSRSISILLLTVVFLSASIACAAMMPALPGCANPCCPKPAPTAPNHCAVGCISNAPVLEPLRAAGSIDFPAAALPAGDPIVIQSHAEPVRESIPFRASDLFLQHRQFLI